MDPYDNPANGRPPMEKPTSYQPPLEGFTTQSINDQHYSYSPQQHNLIQQRQHQEPSQYHQSNYRFSQHEAAPTAAGAGSQRNTYKPVVMLSNEGSRQNSSEGYLNATSSNQTFAFGSGNSSESTGAPPSPKSKPLQVPQRQQAYPAPDSGKQSIPSPPLTRQGPEQPARQYYSLVPGNDQPQLLHDYRPSSAQDAALDPSSGKSKKIPSGISAGKIYVCMGYGDCSKTFTRSEHLARHIRKHTGERPFSCHCGRAFSRLDNLRQHVSSCHAEEFAANQRTLASLGEIHTHLSIKALRDQKRAGQVIELDKEQPEKKPVKRARTKETKKPKKSPISGTERESEAGPGPSTQNHRTTIKHTFVPSGAAMPPVEYDMPPVQPYEPSPVQVMSGPALAQPLPTTEMAQSSVPVTRLSPGYAMRHQPFGPYGRPWTAGRPETNAHVHGQHVRPMTQNSNPDSRPTTANVPSYPVNYMQQAVVGANPGSMASVYVPGDRPVSSRERVNGVPRQFLGEGQTMHTPPSEPSANMRMGYSHLDRTDLQEPYRMNANPSYVYQEQPGVARQVVMNGQIPPQYARSPYEPVPLRNHAGYDGLTSVPPTPQTMQQASQGRLLPGSSSNPSYTSSDSLNSRHSRRSFMSSSGHSYVPEQGMQHYRSIGAASSSQIAEIYGNSVGAQESPFSYHPPPTATHPPSAPLGGQFEPVGGQLYYPGPEPVNTADVSYSMQPQMESQPSHGSLDPTHAQPDMAHYLMSGRHERRRPSLPIGSLIDADPTQTAAPRVNEAANGHHPLPQEPVYYTMPYQQSQPVHGYSNGISPNYSFPNNGMPVSGVYQGPSQGQPIQNGHRPQQHQVGWQHGTGEDPLVGQMDAKARALLEGNGGSYAM